MKFTIFFGKLYMTKFLTMKNEFVSLLYKTITKKTHEVCCNLELFFLCFCLKFQQCHKCLIFKHLSKNKESTKNH